MKSRVSRTENSGDPTRTSFLLTTAAAIVVMLVMNACGRQNGGVERLAIGPRATTAPDEQANWRETWAAMLRNGDLDDIRLSVDKVVRLDAKTLLIGGSYRNPPGSIRSAMLVSFDNGRTWRDTGRWDYGSTMFDFFVLDAMHAWAVDCWSIEGNLWPLTVYRTTDGGMTWARSNPLPEHVDGCGILWICRLTFQDSHRGEILFGDDCGNFVIFTSADGGRRWRLVKKWHLILESEAEMTKLERKNPPQPTNLRAEVSEGDLGNILLVQESSDGGKSWITQGTLPYCGYRAGKEDVIPPDGTHIPVAR